MAKGDASLLIEALDLLAQHPKLGARARKLSAILQDPGTVVTIVQRPSITFKSLDGLEKTLDRSYKVLRQHIGCQWLRIRDCPNGSQSVVTENGLAGSIVRGRL